MDDYRTGYIDEEANRDLEIEELKQQLAKREKQIVLMRDNMEHILEYWNQDRNETAMYDALNHIEDVCIEALAATQDLSGLVLCDAEPAGAVLVRRDTREGIMFYSTDMTPNEADIKDKFELVTVYNQKDKP